MTQDEIIKQIVQLGESKSEEAVSTLIPYLSHQNGNVRRLACSALGKISSPFAERPLVGTLFDEKPQVRQYAIKALRNLGTNYCLPALEQIKNSKAEKPYNVRCATAAINKINSQTQKPHQPFQSKSKLSTKSQKTLLATLSKDQRQVITSVADWTNKPKGTHISVGGYAGTGKTTIIGYLRKLLHHQHPKLKVAFACFTGKASQMLKLKLLQQRAIKKGDTCGTIHSLMYKPRLDKQGKIIGWRRVNTLRCDIIIIDEASMVTEDIWHDLLSYNLPIIAVGDHGQLPPIGDDFNLMQSPQLTLQKIHRHAKDNPIIHIATLARTTGCIPHQEFSPQVKKIPRNTDQATRLVQHIFTNYNSKTLILCGRNHTRVQLNHQIRQILGFAQPEPITGETVICLKNNYELPDGPIYNGMVGTLQSIKPHKDHWYKAQILFRDEQRNFQGHISKHQFGKTGYLQNVKGISYKNIGDRFDFGYALTVHKAQGSQADRVLLFEEPSAHWQGELWNRWLYTAVTRAVNQLYIIG